MKKVVLSVVALAASMAPALAADLVKKSAAPAAAAAPATPAWDIAVGGVVQTDYNFRGVSQSNRGPSAGAYFEPQFNTTIGQIYVGLAGWSINWPGTSNFGFTDPSAEINLYAGLANTFARLSPNPGTLYYFYPQGAFNAFP